MRSPDIRTLLPRSSSDSLHAVADGEKHMFSMTSSVSAEMLRRAIVCASRTISSFSTESSSNCMCRRWPSCGIMLNVFVLMELTVCLWCFGRLCVLPDCCLRHFSGFSLASVKPIRQGSSPSATYLAAKHHRNLQYEEAVYIILIALLSVRPISFRKGFAGISKLVSPRSAQ